MGRPSKCAFASAFASKCGTRYFSCSIGDVLGLRLLFLAGEILPEIGHGIHAVGTRERLLQALDVVEIRLDDFPALGGDGSRLVVCLKIGGAVIENKVVFAVLSFAVVWFSSVAVLSFVLMASGLDFVSSLSAVIACINNMGPGLNQVGPATNYASLSDFQTWVLAFAMVLGRLELFTLLIPFTPAFWRS